jgi:hypothetical protein
LLSVRLSELENQKLRLENQLATVRSVKSGHLTEADLRSLVERNVVNLLEVLKADLSLTRHVLQRHAIPQDWGLVGGLIRNTTRMVRAVISDGSTIRRVTNLTGTKVFLEGMGKQGRITGTGYREVIRIKHTIILETRLKSMALQSE